MTSWGAIIQPIWYLEKRWGTQEYTGSICISTYYTSFFPHNLILWTLPKCLTKSIPILPKSRACCTTCCLPQFIYFLLHLHVALLLIKNAHIFSMDSHSFTYFCKVLNIFYGLYIVLCIVMQKYIHDFGLPTLLLVVLLYILVVEDLFC